jgi:hypothetical protein
MTGGSVVDGVVARADRIVKDRDSALSDVPKPDFEPGSRALLPR